MSAKIIDLEIRFVAQAKLGKEDWFDISPLMENEADAKRIADEKLEIHKKRVETEDDRPCTGCRIVRRRIAEDFVCEVAI
jgi:hypothetical protein